MRQTQFLKVKTGKDSSKLLHWEPENRSLLYLRHILFIFQAVRNLILMVAEWKSFSLREAVLNGNAKSKALQAIPCFFRGGEFNLSPKKGRVLTLHIDLALGSQLMIAPISSYCACLYWLWL